MVKTRRQRIATLLPLGCLLALPLGVQGEPPWVLPAARRVVTAAPLSIEEVDTIAPPTGPEEFFPEALTLDELGRLYALDRAQVRIVRRARGGAWLPFGVGEQGGPRLAQIVRLFARWGPSVYGLDPAGFALYRWDLDGHLRSTVRYDPEQSQALERIDPVDFGLNKLGELLILDRSDGRLLVFDRFGEFVTDFTEGNAGERPVSPVRMAQDEEGSVYLLDPPSARVRRYSRQGELRPAWRYDRDLPKDSAAGAHFALTPWNQVVIAARDASWVRVFDREGGLLLHEDLEAGNASLVTDLVAGPDSLLYLAVPERGEIRRLRLNYPQHGRR